MFFVVVVVDVVVVEIVVEWTSCTGLVFGGKPVGKFVQIAE